MYKVFLSYSWKNSAERERLVKALKRLKNSNLVHDQDMPTRQRVYNWIRSAIRTSDAIIAIITKESVKSKWISQELKDKKKYRNKSHLIEIAIELLKKERGRH